MLGLHCACWAVMMKTLAHLGAHAGPSWGLRWDNFLWFGVVLGWAMLFSWIVMGLCWPIKPPSWGYVGPSWAYVGPSWRHLGAMLGPPGPYISPTLSHLGSVLANPALSWKCVNARTNDKNPIKNTSRSQIFTVFAAFFTHICFTPASLQNNKNCKIWLPCR